MRVEIARLHREIGATMIYVTHDQVEAMTLADVIVVLRAGRVEQVGRPLDLYEDPANRFVAGFIGSPAMNLLAGTARGDGRVAVPALGRDLPVTVLGLAAGQAVDVGLRPQHLTLDASAQSHRVELNEALGGVAYVHVTAPSGERVVVETREGPLPGLGSRVGLAAAGSGALLFDPADGTRLR